MADEWVDAPADDWQDVAPAAPPLAQLQPKFGFSDIGEAQQPDVRSPGELADMAAALGSNVIPYAQVVGGVAGLGTAAAHMLGLTDEEGADAARKVTEAVQYAPRTESGERTQDTINHLMEPISKGADWLGDTVQDQAEKGNLMAMGITPAGGAAAATVANTAAQMAPFVALDAGVKGAARLGGEAPHAALPEASPEPANITAEQRRDSAAAVLADSIPGLNDEQKSAVKANYPAVVKDRVTGFDRSEELQPTIEAAQKTGEPAAYGEIDLRNLGGLNKASGSNAKADTHFSAVADILRDEAKNSDANVVLIRKGGDEIGAVFHGVDKAGADDILNRAQSRIDEYAQGNGLGDIPNPKGGQAGFGIHYGTSDIVPGANIRDILVNADSLVEQRKQGAPYEQRETPETSGTGSPAGEPADERVAADAAGVAAADRAGPVQEPAGETPAAPPAKPLGLPGELDTSLDPQTHAYARALLEDPATAPDARAWLEQNAHDPEQVRTALDHAAAKHAEIEPDVYPTENVQTQRGSDPARQAAEPGSLDESAQARPREGEPVAREAPASGLAETERAARPTSRIDDTARDSVSEPLREVSARNAAIDAHREAMGLEPLPVAERKSFDTSAQQARDMLAKDPNSAQRLVAEHTATGRALNDAEQLVLAEHSAKLGREHEAATAEINRARTAGDQPAGAIATLRREGIENEARGVHKALNEGGGTANARGLAIRNAILKDDYSVGRNMARAEAHYSGLNDRLRSQARELTEHIKKSQDELERVQAQVEKERAAKPAERPTREAKRPQSADEREQARIEKKIAQLKSDIERRLKACPV